MSLHGSFGTETRVRRLIRRTRCTASLKRRGSVLSKQAFAAAALAAVTAIVLPAAAFARAGSAAASSSSKVYVLRATLDAKHQVPAPTDAKAARGLFTGKLTLAGKKSSFVWQL